MRAWADRAARDERGFTLIEVIVVTVVLSLLAALAVASFFTQRGKARDAGAKAAVRTAAEALETYATDRDGTYDGATPAGLIALEPTLAGAALDVDFATGATYRVTVESATGGDFSVERRPGGEWRLECAPAGSAGCPAGGRWD
jgi:type IV pilus assembly protein PilA